MPSFRGAMGRAAGALLGCQHRTNGIRRSFGNAGKRNRLDRFNPYHRFTSVPVSSLAWRLRAEGYRHDRLHPFDRTFYGRDRVMPNLGFDVFLGEEAFAGAQRRQRLYLRCRSCEESGRD